MTSVGSDTTININSTDYSIYIDSYDESGGEKEYKIIKAMNNTYKKILTNITDYEVTLDFRIENGANAKDLFESDTPITIEIIAPDTTITYNNMTPTSFNYKTGPEDILMASLKYKATARDSSGTLNRVLA